MPVYLFWEQSRGSRTGLVRAPETSRARGRLKALGIEVKRLVAVPDFLLPVLDLFAVGSAPLAEKARFLRQLELLYSAGVPLAESLSRLAVDGWSSPVLLGIRRAERSLHRGLSLSVALGTTGFLPKTCVTLVESGEKSGRLAETLERCAEILESDNDSVQRIKSALIYPCFTLSVFLLAFFFLFVFVLPKFAEIFEGLNAKIPLPVALGLKLTVVLGDPMVVFCLLELLLVAALLGRRYLMTERGKERLYTAVSAIPPIGHFLAQSYYANVSFTLSTLIGSGISVTETLALCGKDCPQPGLRGALQRAVMGVENGMSLAEALEVEELPALLCQFIRIGEETGQFDQSLSFLRKLYADETQGAVDRFLALLEPILIIIMGLSVGAFLLGALLPLVSLLGNLGNA